MSGIASWVTAKDLRHRLDADFYRPEYLEFDHRAEARGLKMRQVVEISSLVTDGTHKTPSYVDSGVPFLSAKNIRNGFVDAGSGHKYVSAAEFDQLERWNCAPRPDDVLVAKSGSIGSAGLASGAYDRFAVFESAAIIRPSGVSPAYLSAYLNSRLGQLQIRRNSKGAVIRHLHLEDLREVEVPLPDRRIQDYIGAKVELAERCRAVASREREKLGTELATLYEGCPHAALSSLTTMVAPAEIDGSRLDAWYHQRRFITLTEWLRRNPAFVKLGKVASLSSDRWSPGAHGQSTFRYIEISDVDSSTGHVSHSEVPVENAPSRARKLLRGFDVLASTVRPNRGAVGLVPDSLDGAVATTGFAVVRAVSKTDAFFLLAVLRHPASTAQLMRCNTGSAYPAIEESVLPQIWIPGAKPGTRKSLGARELRRTTLLQTAVDLVDQAKADVEALIEGTLDAQAILAETLKPPTADDIPELAEDDA
ncbi:restriction endonuclease subunit S domain-containing protein [Actinokineospora iranica]|uniref:Type I restriction enzyme, S subunit n=1 Tax=Actinokineospora iranica TaxID=1271860 RepID=A0A1G6W0G3_9PSEU|nr:restriction endonuclease subunit S [Actinokineospora iranica]SDD58717.1 type I restriction enzyme, S subunit [Actinokineospora iranica]